MKKLTTLILILLTFQLNAQSIFGKWKSIDDETGKAKSVVNIYQKDGLVYGDIVSVLNNKNPNPKCSKCEGTKKDKPIIGMQIIEGLKKDDNVYNDGTILNPSNGKVYKCRLKLESPNKLQVRGYVAFFYKTQYWIRVE